MRITLKQLKSLIKEQIESMSSGAVLPEVDEEDEVIEDTDGFDPEISPSGEEQYEPLDQNEIDTDLENEVPVQDDEDAAALAELEGFEDFGNEPIEDVML